MRVLLIISAILIVCSTALSAQKDFKTLDMRTYDFFIRGDYKNLKQTADTMFSQGIDFYYLRMRLGILSFNKQQYPDALSHFNKAIQFNSLDSISGEYIYYSYLFSGRKADANLYLASIPPYQLSRTLKSEATHFSPDFHFGSVVTGSDITLYARNSLYYEAVKNSLSIYAGFESYFLNRFKATFTYTNYRKEGTVYSSSNPSGTNLNFVQNQVYGKLSGYIFPGWEFSGFSHFAFYMDMLAANQKTQEYLFGLGVSKNGWKIRTGANISVSNFSNSDQIRGEGYLTYLPSGNLNLYFTSGGMYQSDKNWGSTYQANQEIGFKILRTLWLESGIVIGNSFLYARYQGYVMNNSFETTITAIYGNIIILSGKHFRITLTPSYAENQIYSWDLNAYTRTGKVTNDSFGGLIRLTYKTR